MRLGPSWADLCVGAERPERHLSSNHVLDLGIPGRDEWPTDVLEQVAAFRQGDLVAKLPMFYWADPGAPVFERTRDYEGKLPGIVEMQEGWYFDYGMITTQTCDLADEGNGKPRFAWAQVCPVYNAKDPHPTDPAKHVLDGGTRKLILEGRDQHRMAVPVPGDGLWVADFRLEVPVERGWLAAQERIVVFSNDADRWEVGRRLAWLRARPAFDSRFVRSVQKPLVSALRVLATADPSRYQLMHGEIAEVGVVSASHAEMTDVIVTVLYDSLSAATKEWWLGQWEIWAELAEAEGLNLLPLEFADLGALSAAEYRRMTRLPLAHISDEPSWYGPDPEGAPVQ